MSQAGASAQYGDAAGDAIEKVSQELVEGLKEYEICPFKGPITVTVTSTKKDKQKEEYASLL